MKTKKKMTKLTKEQLAHYLKGGKFKAIYKPTKTSDLNSKNLEIIGQEVEIHQNVITAPLYGLSDNKGNYFYEGQHAFDCSLLDGWSPEEDFEILEMINEFIDSPEKLPQYMYKITYSTREQVIGNFGNVGKTTVLPITIGRSYSFDMDDYVKKLSNPQADKIEKAIYTGESEEVEWKILFRQKVKTNV